jgi:hypothetical protein
VGALSTAALLYAGAAVVGALSRRPAHREARLQRSDLPRLLAMALFGAALGPVALAWGLQRTSGTSASLMLTLEAPFTAMLAWRLYHETMDRRVWAAMALLLAGGVVLILDQQRGGGAQLWGLLAVALGDRSASGWMALGIALMLARVLLHLAESHGHEHAHEALEHEHAHRHDDGHHDHAHEPMPKGAHSHRHRHEPLQHAHPHVPDVHHGHRH